MDLHILLSQLYSTHGHIELAFNHCQVVNSLLSYVQHAEKWQLWVVALNTRILELHARTADTSSQLPSLVEIFLALLTAQLALVQCYLRDLNRTSAAVQLCQLDQTLLRAGAALEASFEDAGAWPVQQIEFRAQLFFSLGTWYA